MGNGESKDDEGDLEQVKIYLNTLDIYHIVILR